MNSKGRKTRLALPVLLGLLHIAGCETACEKRERLLDRQDAQNASLRAVTSSYSRWDEDEKMDDLYRAMEQTDRELAELEREADEPGLAEQLVEGLFSSLFTGIGNLIVN